MSAGLDVRGLRAGYGAVEALHDVTLSFPLGSVVALLGRNGAGKSSLLRAITGSIRLTSGRIGWEGRDITRMPVFERVAAGIIVVPDGTNVFPALTVAENLALFGGGAAPEPAYALFPELAGKGEQLAGTLSGGERQMLALGRLLLRPGRALLLDEPGAGLAAGAVDRLYGCIRDLASPDRVIVVVGQFHPEILRLADLVYVLSRGEVAWAGEAGELATGSLPAALV